MPSLLLRGVVALALVVMLTACGRDARSRADESAPTRPATTDEVRPEDGTAERDVTLARARLLFAEGEGSRLGLALASPPAAQVLGVRAECEVGDVRMAPLDRVVPHPNRAALLGPRLEHLIDWPLPALPDRCEVTVWADAAPGSMFAPSFGPECVGPRGIEPTGCAHEEESAAVESEAARGRVAPIEVLSGVMVGIDETTPPVAQVSLLVRKTADVPEGTELSLRSRCPFGISASSDRREELIAAWTTGDADPSLSVPVGRAFIDGHLVLVEEGIEDCELEVVWRRPRGRTRTIAALRRGAPLEGDRGHRLVLAPEGR